MGWMDSTEYCLIEEAPIPRLATLLYVASALRARPRAIDRYIDYFGDQARERAENAIGGFHIASLPVS